MFRECKCLVDLTAGEKCASITSMKSPYRRNLAWLEGDTVVVMATYSEAFVQDCRQIEGRRWDNTRKVNTFPMTSAAQVRELCEKYKVTMPAELLKADNGGAYFSTSGEQAQVRIENDELVIQFDYNPRRTELFKATVPGYRWDTGTKTWRAPLSSTNQVLRFGVAEGLTASTHLVDQIKDAMEEAEARRVESSALHGTIDIPNIAHPLLPYQQAGVVALKNRRHAILADEMGLGKSVQATATVVSEERYPMLVVCPNTLKINWQREVLKFFPHLSVSLLYGTSSTPIPASDVVVVNYDIAYDRADDIFEHGFRSLVVDESHAIKNGKKQMKCPHCGSKVRSNAVNCPSCRKAGIKPIETWTVRRAAAVMKFARSLSKEDFILLLTGTPIQNRPEELVAQLDAIGFLEDFGGEWRFKQRYAPERNVATNTKELNDRLRELCLIRRLKKDVYEELPALIPAEQYLEIDKSQMSWYYGVESDAVEYFAGRAKALAEEAGEDGDDAYWEKRLRLERVENLIRITAVRDAVSKIKFDAMVAWIDNFLDASDDKKVIVFAEHIELVEALYDRYKDIAVKVRGGVSNKARMAAVDKFQDDPACRIFVANMTAAKEGLTLTAASDVVFCELAWTPSQHEQCAARCYGRVNDLHGATAWYLMAPNTVDEDIYELLAKKAAIVDAVTDGVEDDGPVSIEDDDEKGSIMGDLIVRLAKRGMNK